ncbi:hypothetical protein [Streptomyces palmae]|uniref:Uncharacterized protein n=1 Tax=Streptomyces palmae TaxID=1701085 RepID=A0A4Z0HD33_9ACTN|nr:hypothetical protein [Streptomyces palmae]TGB18105.1 hypothetical protein E4099_02475 [Streptomyces palmae]
MGWTHDYGDAPRDRGSDTDATTTLRVSERRSPAYRQTGAQDPCIGIPRILRRRARYVSARLRHPRG